MELTGINQQSQRIEKWDLIKALLIFLVVLGHFVDYYTDDSYKMRALFLFIYMFHMPCFLFINGLFSKNCIDRKNYTRIFSYLVLYIFARMLMALMKGIINQSFDFSLFNGDSYSWYALVLFWHNLMTIFLKRFPKKWVLCASVLLACFVGYDSSISDVFTLSRMIVFFPFFYMGYCSDAHQIEKQFSHAYAKVLGILALVLVAVLIYLKADDLYFLRPILTGRNPYITMCNSYGMSKNIVSWGGLIRLAYYAVAALLCAAVIAVIPSRVRILHFLQGVGKRSLPIYLLHRPIIYILYEGFHIDDWFGHYGLSNLVIIPLALLLTLALSMPVLEKLIRTIIYPRVLNNKT